METDPLNTEVQTTSTEPITSTVVPPTDPAPVTPTVDPSVLAAYNGLIAEQNQRNRALEEELARLKAAPAPAPVTSDEFFANPAAAIKSEVAAAIAPLNAFVQKQQRDSQYAALKSQMRADPRFDRLSEFEAEFDQMLSNIVLDANAPNTMIAAYYSVLGHKVATGQLSATKAAPTPTPAPTPTVTTPPHLRPTPPSVPAPAPKATLRPLTENEERVRRMNNMTHEEYLREMDGPFSLEKK